MTTLREHPALSWACNLGLAFLIAYAANPIASMLLLAADQWASLPAGIGMNAILVLQFVVFALSLVWLMRIPAIMQRIGSGLKVAGILFLLSVVAMIVVAVFKVQGASTGRDAGAAAFFMVLIFGGAYGLIGTVLLIGGIVVSRRDKRIQAGA